MTSPVRRPFTEFKEPAGEGEVNEEVIGSGPGTPSRAAHLSVLSGSVGRETGLVAGSVAAPTLTTAVVSVNALARMADYLHLLYGLLRERVDS